MNGYGKFSSFRKELNAFHCVKCKYWTTDKELFGKHIKKCKGD